MMKSLNIVGLMGGLVLSLVCASQAAMAKGKAPVYNVVEVKNGGTIVGTVKFEGNVPKAKMLKIDKDEQTCGHGQMASEELVINPDNMGVKYAVVSLDDIAEGKAMDTAPVTLDQKGCMFEPHVVALCAGTEVNLLNSDNIMHNLHSWSIRNPAFNEGVSGNGSMVKKFDIPEMVKITCDVHKWMSSYLVVKGNPYFAVTDADGKFKMDNVPAGKYAISVWQEKLGKRKGEVTVAAGGEAVVDFVYAKK
ncbi:MAG: hypothetical protein E3K37_13825 [Candidatus Kuenenia sp.]|nr:hypothetical protein [Candidatus Kuenenia hertensis]